MKGLNMTDGVKTRIFEDSETGEFSHFVFKCLRRFLEDDWGEMEEDDKKLNDEAVKTGDRILAVYNLNDIPVIMIIADPVTGEDTRRVVTILLPEEY